MLKMFSSTQQKIAQLCMKHDISANDFLGKGTYGYVFSLDSTTVLKIIRIQDTNPSKQLIQRKLEEGEFLKKMYKANSERFVKLYSSEYIPESNLVYMIMERCVLDLGKLMTEGPPDLIDRLKEKKKSTDFESLWVQQGFSILAELKKQNILHLDIKPGNIVLDEHFNLKLIDFGMSQFNTKMLWNILKKINIPSYTHWYRSPEVFLLKRLSKEHFYGAELWAMACTLYDILYFLATQCEYTQSLFSSERDVPYDESTQFNDPNQFTIAKILLRTSDKEKQQKLLAEISNRMSFETLKKYAETHIQAKQVMEDKDQDRISSKYQQLLNQILQYDHTQRPTLEHIQHILNTLILSQSKATGETITSTNTVIQTANTKTYSKKRKR